MADILSDLKEGGDDGTPNTVVPVREEPSGLQCAPSGVCGQDPHLNKEATLHATEVQQGECESNTIHPVQARDAKPSEEAVDEPGRLAVTDGSEAAEAFKKQDDEIGLGFDKSEVAKANVSQAKDPPEGEHDQAEGKKLMTEHNESPPHEGASCETLSVVTKSSESPPALYDGTSEHSPPTTSELPAEVLKKSDIPTENCSSSVDGCQELPRSLSNPILSSTEIPTDADLHSSGSVSSDPQQEKITEALTESQGSSKCSSHIASSETAEIEGNSTLLSCSSTASDLCVAKEVQHSVVDSPSQSSPLALVPTETSSAEQESGNKMAMLVNQSLGKETEPDSQMCPQSTESKSLDKVSGEKDGAVTEGEENSAENEVPGNPENHDGEMIVEQLKSCNNAHLISETDTETLPQIVAIRSLSHEHATEEYTYRGKPTAPTSLEMEATKMKIVPILVSEPLKPVTIGSSLQPLEEVQEASVEVQEASVVEDTSFSTDIAIIDSSADEADSIGGLVINNVIGAADGVADFQPDEVETEKELTDISASAPQLEDSSDSGDERGPSAKRRKLENGPNSVEDKSNSAKKVILKVIPVKNGHGLWDSMKLQEVLLTNGTILLQIHASKESMELFEPDKNDQTIDFTAIMAEAKDDDHALALGRVEPECDDPLGFINTSQPPQTTTFRPSYGRPFAHSHIRSTALMPAMPRPTFKHLQTPQQYHMKNEVLGLPPPLEFEEPQIGPSSSDWSGFGFNSKSTMHQNSPLLYGNLDAQLQGAKERGQSVKVTKVCRLCDVTLDSPADFEKHQHCVLLSCRKCQFQAKTLDSFNEHIRKHQTKYLEQKCNICQEVFSSPITHAVHKRKIHGVYDCRYCIAEFLSKTDWSNHMKVSHNEIGKKNTNLAQTSKQDPPHRKLLVHNMPKSLSNPASKQDPSPHRKLLVHSMPMSVSNPASKQDPSPHRKLLVHNMPMSVSNPPAGLIMCSPPQSIDDLCTTNMPTPSAICNPQIYSRNTPRKQPLTLIEEVIIKVEPSSDTESAVPQTILKKVKQKRKKRLEKMREFQGLPCESCPAAFKTLTALRIHVKQKHTEKPRCPVCGLTRSSARKVFQHQITAHKEKFRCRSYCLELFDTREELSAHHISVHKKDDTVNKCRYCRIPYTRGTYEEHLQECLGDIRAKRVKTCPLCDRKFVDHAEFSHHLKTCESSGGKPDEEGESPGTSGSVGKKPIGKKLEELESNAKQLDKHPVLVNMQNVESIEKKSGESAMLKLEDTNQCVTNSFKCRFCPKVFHCEENGVDHMINQHKTVFSHMKEYKVCDICGKLFISGLSLCKHLVMHYEKRAVWNKLVPANFSKNDIKGNCWICKTSGVSYSPNHCKARNSIIDKHLHSKACKTSVTDSNETFHCCLCKETFSDVHGYWNHIKIHLHKNPSASTKKDQYFSCPRCPQKYKKEAQLMEHVAMHLIQQDSHGERNEKSKSNSTLADTKDKMDENLSEEELQEEANHTELETDASVDNMGTFKCLHCKQGFGVKSDALNHLLSIHNKVLKEIISLKSCHLCDKSFLKGSSLCSHILNHYIELGMWEDMVPRNLLSKIDKQRCWICNTVFRNKKRGHQRIRNDCIEKSLSSRSEQLEEDEQFQCPLCEFSCSNRYDHWKHIKLHLFLNKNFLGKTNADSKGEKTDADSKGEKTDADSKGEKMDADSKGEKTDADSKGEKMDADSKGEQSTPMLDSVKGKFDCLKCNEQFTESLDFRKHIATHFLRLCEKRKRKISEVDCDEQEAKKRKTMTLRSTSFRPGHGNLRCVCCSGTFSSSEDAIYHVLFAHKDKVTQAKEPEFACKVCGASFKGGWWLCKHVINHYVNLEMWNALVPRDLVNNLNKRNQCWICKCVLDKNYVGHISKRNAYIEPLLTANCKEKTSLFDCSLCNLQFPTRPKYWLHMTSHLCQPPTEFTPQNLPLPKEDKKKDYECSDCTLYFQNEEEYHKHLASHFLECTEEEKSATSIGLEEHGREEFVPSRESSDDEWLPPSIVKTKIDESMTQEDEKGNNCQEEMEGDDNVANDSESEDEENVGYDKEDEGDENVAYDREDEGEVDVAYDREDEGDENVAHDSEPDIIVENIKTEDEGSSWFEEM